MKIKSFLLFVIFSLVLGLSSCQQFSNAAAEMFAGDTTAVIFPAPLGSVSDYERILTNDQIRTLDSIIIRHEKRTKNKISLVTTRSIKPYKSLDEYSNDLFNEWKLDDKGNSVLVVFSEKIDDIYITPGAGLKKRLTEKECKRIIKKTIRPEMEKGDSFSALKKGLEKIIEEIR